jgi:hypothetical protein
MAVCNLVDGNQQLRGTLLPDYQTENIITKNTRKKKIYFKVLPSKRRKAIFLFTDILVELCNNLLTASEKVFAMVPITFSSVVAYINVFIFYSQLISERILILLFELWSISHSCMKVYT